MHNVDDLLNNNINHDDDIVETPQDVEKSKHVEHQREPIEQEEQEEQEEKLNFLDQFRKDKEEILGKKEVKHEKEEVAEESESEEQQVESDIVDEYGVEVEKPKTYTEEEVQAMIRKRLKLHHEEKQQPYNQQQPQMTPQQQEAAQSFEHDPESEESWEVQLERHINRTIDRREQKKQESQWKAEAERSQHEFEVKFTSGMSRYKDFNDVVAGKPITNGIMMAARSMADPAAFIYAASKQQPKELERIAQISDPYQLAAEVGRLEERMRKARKTSSAPKPVSKIQSDVHGKYNEKRSLDDLIRMDAKKKLGRR